MNIMSELNTLKFEIFLKLRILSDFKFQNLNRLPAAGLYSYIGGSGCIGLRTYFQQTSIKKLYLISIC
jgi:hypothetical protein